MGCPKHNISRCYKPGCVHTDGFQRLIVTINRYAIKCVITLFTSNPLIESVHLITFYLNYLDTRQLPGPAVVVCQGDAVHVEVHNRLRGDSTSIHFHGML